MRLRRLMTGVGMAMTGAAIVAMMACDAPSGYCQSLYDQAYTLDEQFNALGCSDTDEGTCGELRDGIAQRWGNYNDSGCVDQFLK